MVQIRQGLNAYQRTGAALTLPYFLALLAEAYGRGGQPENGLAAVAEALNAVDSHQERWWQAELLRLRGELLLAQESKGQKVETAEECFRQALAVACRQQARSLELRAAMSLARLWQRQGKRAAAWELLAPVYDWFTEGFATADLQEAKKLLVTLKE